MEAGNVNEFLEKITWQEEAVMFRGRKYFFNPKGAMDKAEFEIQLWDRDDCWEGDVFYAEAATIFECIKMMTEAKIWDGLTFWEAEGEMTWVEW